MYYEYTLLHVASAFWLKIIGLFTLCLCLCLQEVWACWCELLSYLEQENAFLDQLEQKLDETDNLEGRAEELQEALDVSIRRGQKTLHSATLKDKDVSCFQSSYIEIWFRNSKKASDTSLSFRPFLAKNTNQEQQGQLLLENYVYLVVFK